MQNCKFQKCKFKEKKSIKSLLLTRKTQIQTLIQIQIQTHLTKYWQSQPPAPATLFSSAAYNRLVFLMKIKFIQCNNGGFILPNSCSIRKDAPQMNKH